MKEITVADLLQLMPEDQKCCIWSESSIFVCDAYTAGEMLQELDEFVLTSPVRELDRSFNQIRLSID